MRKRRDPDTSSSRNPLRKQAEERLRAKRSDPGRSRSGHERERLLHELQVHQIELESQNAELRRVQEELEVSRTRYFELYDLAPVGYLTLGDKGVIRETNLTAAALLGVAKDALIDQMLTSFIIPEDQDTFYLHNQRLAETGKPQVCELQMLRKDGTAFWARLEAASGPDTSRTTACRLVLVDITVRKRIEETHSFLLQCGYPGSKESFFESLARYLAQNLDMEYVCIDRLEGDGLTAETVAIYNDGTFDPNIAYALKDTPCGTVVGRTICCYPSDVCRLFPNDAALLELEAVSYIGTTLWGHSGKPIGLIAVIGRKPLANPRLAESLLKLVAIRAAGELERKQAEDEIRRLNVDLEGRVVVRTAQLEDTTQSLRAEMAEHGLTEQALSESEKRYRDIVASVTDYIYSVRVEDGRAVETLHGAACVALTGYTAEEFASDPELWIRMVEPTDRALVTERVQQILAGHEIPPIEHRLIRKDGVVRWVSDTAILHKDADGRLLSYDGVLKDISERKQAEAERLRMEGLARRRERLALLGELAAGVAHELRNPLQGVMSYMDLVKLKAGDETTLTPMLQHMEEGLREMDRVAAQLLDLSRQEQDPMAATPLGSAIERAWAFLQVRATKQGVSLSQTIEHGLPHVKGNLARLTEAFLNLLKNALEALGEPGAGVPGTIRVAARVHPQTPGVVEVLIEDNGPGIPVDIRGKVFQPFFTTKPSGKGTGLGLAMVRKTVESCGGYVEVVATPLPGTTICLGVPVAGERHMEIDHTGFVIA